MSIEKLSRKALRRAVFWRCVVAALDFPANLLNALAGVIHRVADLFGQISDTVFYFEADAARQYRTLTGVDLGFAAKGDLERYGGTNPKALAQAEAEEFQEDVYDDDD